MKSQNGNCAVSFLALPAKIGGAGGWLTWGLMPANVRYHNESKRQGRAKPVQFSLALL